MKNTVFKGVKMYTVVHYPNLACFLRSTCLEIASNSALLTFLGPSLSGEVAATSLHQAK